MSVNITIKLGHPSVYSLYYVFEKAKHIAKHRFNTIFKEPIVKQAMTLKYDEINIVVTENDYDTPRIKTFEEGFKIGLTHKDSTIDYSDAYNTYNNIITGNVYNRPVINKNAVIYPKCIKVVLDFLINNNATPEAAIGFIIGICVKKIERNIPGYFDSPVSNGLTESAFRQLLFYIRGRSSSDRIELYKLITNGLFPYENKLWYEAYMSIRSKEAFLSIPEEARKWNNYELVKNITAHCGTEILKWITGEEKKAAKEVIDNDPSLIPDWSEMIKYRFLVKGKQMTQKELETLRKLYPSFEEFKKKYILS